MSKEKETKRTCLEVCTRTRQGMFVDTQCCKLCTSVHCVQVHPPTQTTGCKLVIICLHDINHAAPLYFSNKMFVFLPCVYSPYSRTFVVPHYTQKTLLQCTTSCWLLFTKTHLSLSKTASKSFKKTYFPIREPMTTVTGFFCLFVYWF